MFRSLNQAFTVCGKFYSDDRALREMLEAIIQKFNLQTPRSITYPRGHFHYASSVIGGILDRNFHFIFYLQADAERAIIDVCCDDSPENHIAISEIIREHCQPAVVETLPLNLPLVFSTGNYVNFKAKFMNLSQAIDRVTLVSNSLKLGLARASFVVPPAKFEDERGFDFMQLFPSGYFAIHDAKSPHNVKDAHDGDAEDFLEVDIFLKEEMSTDILKNWFPGCSEVTFLQRTFSVESLC